MEQNLSTKSDLINKLISFHKENKIKIYSMLIIFLITSIAIIIYQINNENKNNLISEKYVQAGLYLSSGEKEKSKVLYEEIILSKNKFYSNLALNTILENNLEIDKNKILSHFEILEKLNISEEQLDLLNLKKALYLIKISKNKNANKLLNNLIEKNSVFKNLAEEALTK